MASSLGQFKKLHCFMKSIQKNQQLPYVLTAATSLFAA